MTTTRVYRSGSLVPAQYAGEVLEFAEKADAARPEGHAPRHGSLYASPAIDGVGRWADANNSRSNRNADFDGTTREIAVNPEGLFVYNVEAWENFSWRNMDASTYWDTAIPLADWNRVAEERNLDASEWEVLVPVTTIISARNISNKRLITSQPEGSLVRHNLMWTLEPKKAFKSIKW